MTQTRKRPAARRRTRQNHLSGKAAIALAFALILLIHPALVGVILTAAAVFLAVAAVTAGTYVTGLVAGWWKPPARIMRHPRNGWSVEFL